MATPAEILLSPAARPGPAERPPADAYKLGAFGLYLLAEGTIGPLVGLDKATARRAAAPGWSRVPALEREAYLSDAGPIVEALWSQWETYRQRE
jgi:hypothetical protein